MYDNTLSYHADIIYRLSRVDLTVLPLLCIGFLVFQFDRMNLASALTDGFADYVKIDQDTINLGNQLLFLGTVALEIPSNMLLQKVPIYPFILTGDTRCL